MGFRITTNMMMNTYRYNLQGSTKKLSDARDMVLTHRNFNRYAEDPAAATQEFRLRRDLYDTYSQLNNNNNVYSKYSTAFDNLQGVTTNMINATGIESVMRGTNDPTGEARRSLATVLRETSESIIYAMNQKLGDQFIFAGNDGLNVPFEWKMVDGNQQLFYRGINVNTKELDKPTAAEPKWLSDWEAALEGGLAGGTVDQADYDAGMAWIKYYRHETDIVPDTTVDPTESLKNLAAADPDAKEDEWIAYYAHQAGKPTADEPAWGKKDENGVPENMPAASTDKVEQGWIDYYTAQGDLNKLKAMSDEQLYIDLGMGLAEHSANNAVNGSYFNSALCGIDFVGFGVDEDGDPKNLAMLMREFADIFQAWDEDMDPQGYNPELAGPTAQGLSSTEMKEKAWRLLNKFKDSREHFVEKWDELDAQSVFLKTNKERLETQFDDTNTQILDISQVDLADAITSFSWQQYCYNAALKIGNQLLSQSLIDYMH